jgi:hypothetical protein
LIIDINKGLFEKISHSSSADSDLIDLQSFIYDKDKIVGNMDAFCKTYHKSLEIDGKQIETIIMQPVVM